MAEEETPFLIRTRAQGHIFRSEDGVVPYLIDGDHHTYVDCDACYRSVCMHDPGSEAIFSDECRRYEPELPGMEIPIVEIPRWAKERQKK